MPEGQMAWHSLPEASKFFQSPKQGCKSRTKNCSWVCPLGALLVRDASWHHLKRGRDLADTAAVRMSVQLPGKALGYSLTISCLLVWA